jgi:hypothetical protein
MSKYASFRNTAQISAAQNIIPTTTTSLYTFRLHTRIHRQVTSMYVKRALHTMPIHTVLGDPNFHKRIL